jgi:methylmalonyl-CoA mutase C-terminal domain/subunit
MSRKIRVLVAKPGLDGHDRGAKVIAKALRDAGMEVIYTGLHQTPIMIVQTALDEDVDVIGLSILSGAHLEVAKEIMDLLKKEGVDQEKLVVMGGVIPESDHDELIKLGIKQIFTPGASLEKMVHFINQNIKIA